MIEYTTVRDRTLEGLTLNMMELSKRGWRCFFVTKERGVKLKWVALMECPVRVVEVKHGLAKDIKLDPWGSTRNELPLSERRALAGDPAAYRSADESIQKEPDPQS